jgi:hypothetical protein
MLTGGTAATAAVAGGTALAAYLNGKFHIRKDLYRISRLKKGKRGYEKAGTCVESTGNVSERYAHQSLTSH